MPMKGRFQALIFVLLCGMFGLLLPVHAADRGVDVSLIGSRPLSLTQYLGVLEDASQTLTLSDVRRPDVAAQFKTDAPAALALGFGYSKSDYWLRLHLRNPSAQALERMLEIGYARLSSIEFYQQQADGTFKVLKTGTSTAFATRAEKNRFFVFPLNLPARSEQVIFLRMHSNSAMLIPARLWETQAFHDHERKDYAIQAAYFGAAFALILFNLMLFIAIRDRIFLFYVAFGTAMALTLAEQNGLSTEFLWPNAPWWSDISTGISYSLASMALLLLMRHMLQTRMSFPRLDLLIRLFAWIYVPFIFALIFAYQFVVVWQAWFHLMALLLIFFTGTWCAVKRKPGAIYFNLAFIVLCLGGVASIMRSLAWLPDSMVTINLLQLGSLFELLLLAFALADRFVRLRQATEKAQSEALRAQQLLVESLKSSEQLLETRVLERTEQLMLANQQLEALSATDGLTGVANRRRFDAVLASEWSRATRTAQPLALAMLDIDWFKKYNDHYGHQAGDECLRRVAKCFAETLNRKGDLVARYGGEEFVFIAPGTDEKTALRLAQKACDAIAALRLPHEMSDFRHVTASLGVAVMIPTRDGNPETLVQRADAALYRAKGQGRNQVALWMHKAQHAGQR